jgi:hypothetical protein
MILSNGSIMALGELIDEARGKVTGQRVLNVEWTPKMETSFAMREIIWELHAQMLGLTRPC